MALSKYQQKSKSISSVEPNYFVHFAMRYPVWSSVNFLQVLISTLYILLYLWFFPFSNLKHSGICYFGPLYNTIHVSHFVAVQNNYFSIQFPNQSAPNILVHDFLAKIVCVVSTINLVLSPLKTLCLTSVCKRLKKCPWTALNLTTKSFQD